MEQGNGQKITPRPGERRYWLDEPRNVDKVFYAVVAVCGALALAGLFFPPHIVFSVEGWFAFYGIFGFVGCVGLVLGARELRKLVMRGEDYYGDD
jgi:hypothetical protein